MKVRLLIAAVALVLGCSAVTRLFAAQTQPGGADDPVVTRSYVENRIQQALSGYIQSGSPAPEAPADISGVVVKDEAFAPVYAEAGQTVKGLEGAEIILRSGKATAYCPGENGVIDVSRGADLQHGQAIEQNHLIIVPRADGRGVTAATEIWLIIKGGYEITP